MTVTELSSSTGSSPLMRIFPMIISGMLLDPKTGEMNYKLYNDVYYVVVVDCGSSGSRLHAYKFSLPTATRRLDADGSEKVNLVDELYIAKSPGLASYADNPENGTEDIVNMIKEADYFIPSDKKAVTPLVVRATAGLRALPKEKADTLLDHVYIAISKLDYKVDKKSVKILKEADEGIYMWYAVNLLTDNIGKDTTMASLEIGGASAQITHLVKSADVVKHSVDDLFVRPAVFSSTLFSHSFLGQGIGAARFGSLQLESGHPEPQKHYLSVCVDPTLKEHTFNFFGQIVSVSGISRKGLSPEAVFTRCREIVQQYIKLTMKSIAVQGVPVDNGVAAMGYYYQFANEEGLIPADESGEISIHKIMAHAMGPNGGCATSNERRPWSCFDAVYIVSLLQDGYGFDESTMLIVYNDIDGYGVEWSLGLAYNYVMSAITAQPGPANVYDNYMKSILSKRRK